MSCPGAVGSRWELPGVIFFMFGSRGKNNVGQPFVAAISFSFNITAACYSFRQLAGTLQDMFRQGCILGFRIHGGRGL